MVPASGYNLPTPDPTSPLTNPSHSQLHSDANAAINDLDNRVGAVEDATPELSADIEQARLAAHTWSLPGPLDPALVGTLLVPLQWNMTGRPVQYQAAKATLTVLADADLIVDIVNGSTLQGPGYDSGLHTSILANGPLVIPAGEYFSASVAADGFVTVQSIETYLAAVITQLGSTTAPGGSLTVQLNRLL